MKKEDRCNHKKFGSVSLDLWPMKDWFRFKLYRWSPGHYFQLTIGPLRIDWACQ